MNPRWLSRASVFLARIETTRPKEPLMNPKTILVLIGIFIFIIASYLLADSQNLGGLFRTPTPTLTNTATPTNSPTATSTQTPTMTASQTQTPTFTLTFTPTSTATNTPVPPPPTKKPKDDNGGNNDGNGEPSFIPPTDEPNS